jgi:GntR family transcriptional regulator/MocR family aminotransferase
MDTELLTLNTVPFTTSLNLHRRRDAPLYRQIYGRIRLMILNGQLRGGMRLPSTRELADSLRLSRSTVQNAFDQLLAEGYLEGRIGSGTYVVELPAAQQRQQTGNSAQSADRAKNRAISGRGRDFVTTERSLSGQTTAAPSSAFRIGLPALDRFPRGVWGRLLGGRWREGGDALLGYLEPSGYRPLREAIAGYLGAARGIHCSPDQVVIVAGSQQALDLAARVLLNPGDSVWIEDPGYLGARGALQAAGADLIPIPVDSDGLDIVEAVRKAPQARLAYVSPSHQFPLGATLSLPRRLRLLEWASQNNAWVLEDDYDSEYRFRGRPLAALQNLDSDGRVIYVGTFSKTLFPALRLGYVIPPRELVEVFSAARHIADRHSSGLEQGTLTDFITQGHFSRHVRRMRKLYAARQAMLLESAQNELDGLLELRRADTGMHLVGWLPAGVDDRLAARKAAEFQVDVLPLSRYSLAPLERGGLLLGYGAVKEEDIRPAVRRLAQALRA